MTIRTFQPSRPEKWGSFAPFGEWDIFVQIGGDGLPLADKPCVLADGPSGQRVEVHYNAQFNIARRRHSGDLEELVAKQLRYYYQKHPMGRKFEMKSELPECRFLAKQLLKNIAVYTRLGERSRFASFDSLAIHVLAASW